MTINAQRRNSVCLVMSDKVKLQLAVPDAGEDSLQGAALALLALIQILERI